MSCEPRCARSSLKRRLIGCTQSLLRNTLGLGTASGLGPDPQPSGQSCLPRGEAQNRAEISSRLLHALKVCLSFTHFPPLWHVHIPEHMEIKHCSGVIGRVALTDVQGWGWGDGYHQRDYPLHGHGQTLQARALGGPGQGLGCKLTGLPRICCWPYSNAYKRSSSFFLFPL